VGIVRSGDRLSETAEILDFWGHYTLDKIFDDTAGWEMQNKLTVARLIAMCALERSESIGVHHRQDRAAASKSTYHTTVERRSEGTKATRTADWPG
jgi:aspartate oxidase